MNIDININMNIDRNIDINKSILHQLNVPLYVVITVNKAVLAFGCVINFSNATSQASSNFKLRPEKFGNLQ